MKLRIKVFGYEIASVTLDFDQPVEVNTAPIVTKGIKKMSTWWVRRGMS